MRNLSQLAAAITLGLFSSLVARADKPYTLTQLNCTANNGEPNISAGVYAYALDSNVKTSPNLFSVYLSGSRYSSLLNLGASGSGYSTCTLANLPQIVLVNVTILDVNAVGVGIDVGAGSVDQDTVAQTYTEVIFSFSSETNILNGKVAPKTILTPQQQARALEAFKVKSAALMRH